MKEYPKYFRYKVILFKVYSHTDENLTEKNLNEELVKRNLDANDIISIETEFLSFGRNMYRVFCKIKV